ncbi:hypothetical protein CR513_09465, partial [Mucuna pruriens]
MDRLGGRDDPHFLYTPEQVGGDGRCHLSRGGLATESKEQFFYFYKTLFSKLDITLPFTKFEQVVLCLLNIVPTQLHPNSWAFVWVFKLLSEDMGRESSLSVFFWFFSLRWTEKVG